MSGDFGRLENNGPTFAEHGIADTYSEPGNGGLHREGTGPPLMLAPLYARKAMHGSEWQKVIDVYMRGVRELPRTFEPRSPK